MEEPTLPNDDAPTSEWVRYGERRVGRVLADELSGYLELGQDVIDAAGPLVEKISEQPGDTKPIHAAALILARISSELSAGLQLLRLGYAAQAITLAGTMLELTHVLAYIGADEERAKDWEAWTNPVSTYPGSLSKTIKATAAAFGADEETTRREYEVIYRQICQIKHGNTLALPLPNSAIVVDHQYVVIGPILTDEFKRLGHAAAQWLLRYGILAQTAFLHFHIAAADRAILFDRTKALAERHRDLVRTSKERFDRAPAKSDSQG